MLPLNNHSPTWVPLFPWLIPPASRPLIPQSGPKTPRTCWRASCCRTRWASARRRRDAPLCGIHSQREPVFLHAGLGLTTLVQQSMFRWRFIAVDPPAAAALGVAAERICGDFILLGGAIGELRAAVGGWEFPRSAAGVLAQIIRSDAGVRNFSPAAFIRLHDALLSTSRGQRGFAGRFTLLCFCLLPGNRATSGHAAA